MLYFRPQTPLRLPRRERSRTLELEPERFSSSRITVSSQSFFCPLPPQYLGESYSFEGGSSIWVLLGRTKRFYSIRAAPRGVSLTRLRSLLFLGPLLSPTYQPLTAITHMLTCRLLSSTRLYPCFALLQPSSTRSPSLSLSTRPRSVPSRRTRLVCCKETSGLSSRTRR